MPFGWSYYLDMYKCREGVCDDMEAHYRFLEELVDRLGMTLMSAPIVIHAPRKQGVELYPDKAGITGFAPLIESGITIHSIEPAHFATLDVYSCKIFEPDKVLQFAKEIFGFNSYHHDFFVRGLNYATPTVPS